MSCPDWRRLDPAARDASGAPHAAADAAHALDGLDGIDALDALHAVHWREALSHLDSGCPDCWREALAVDPTLIFRRLPAPELTPAQEAEEVEAARLAVAAMRTASRLDSRGDAGSRSASGLLRRWQDRQDGPAIGSRPSLHVHTARWALAAGLTAMALVYGSGHGGWRPLRPITAATVPASGHSPAGSAAAAGSESAGTPSNQAGQAGQDVRATSAFVGWAGASAVQPASSRPSIEGLSRPEARVYQIDSPHMSVVMIVDGKLDV